MADYCSEHLAAMVKEVNTWNSDDLLRTSDREVVDHLVQKYSVSCPILRRDDQFRTESVRVDLPVRSPIPGMEFAARAGRPRTVPGTQFTVIIPFDGDMELFFRRHNPFTRFNVAMPEVEIQRGEVRIQWTHSDQDPADADQINVYVNQQISDLQRYLDCTATQVQQFNGTLARQAAQLVVTAKERVARERDVSAKLEFPLRRRQDADQYLVPVNRRLLAMRPESAAASPKPEPCLADQAFEDVLRVLIHSRNALERSPSLAQALGEDQIRDILLISLNAVFEGAATGETFNHLGRTDILVRVRDTNVFVGECKVWSTETVLTEALDDQLLRYLTWRDTKGALLLFIRNQQVAPVIDKAIDLIQQHPNYIETLPGGTHHGRHDFVLHANGDPQKKIHIAFLPFALGPVSKRKKNP